MLIQTTCKYCKGSGKAESLVERTANGDWVPNAMLDHTLADAWIAEDSHAPIRWDVCNCPICAGDGEYVLETTPCRIF